MRTIQIIRVTAESVTTAARPVREAMRVVARTMAAAATAERMAGVRAEAR
jgi:hypothetical protein